MLNCRRARHPSAPTTTNRGFERSSSGAHLSGCQCLFVRFDSRSIFVEHITLYFSSFLQITFLKQSESNTVCYSTGGRGGRNAHFLVGDQDDSDEEEEEGGSPKKGYFSDPESEESEDKSK